MNPFIIRTVEQRKELIRLYKASRGRGVSYSNFCKKHHTTITSLYKWMAMYPDVGEKETQSI